MLRPEPSYQQDVMGIAGNVIKGDVELAIKRLKKWAKIWNYGKYKITPKDMWGDVLAEVSRALPSLRHKLMGIEKWKSYGKTEYYRFGWGKIPVDEAILRQEQEIENAESAPFVDIGED